MSSPQKNGWKTYFIPPDKPGEISPVIQDAWLRRRGEFAFRNHWTLSGGKDPPFVFTQGTALGPEIGFLPSQVESLGLFKAISQNFPRDFPPIGSGPKNFAAYFWVKNLTPPSPDLDCPTASSNLCQSATCATALRETGAPWKAEMVKLWGAQWTTVNHGILTGVWRDFNGNIVLQWDYSVMITMDHHGSIMGYNGILIGF